MENLDITLLKSVLWKFSKLSVSIPGKDNKFLTLIEELENHYVDGQLVLLWNISISIYYFSTYYTCFLYFYHNSQIPLNEHFFKKSAYDEFYTKYIVGQNTEELNKVQKTFIKLVNKY